MVPVVLHPSQVADWLRFCPDAPYILHADLPVAPENVALWTTARIELAEWAKMDAAREVEQRLGHIGKND